MTTFVFSAEKWRTWGRFEQSLDWARSVLQLFAKEER